jgi:hypothetical protein
MPADRASSLRLCLASLTTPLPGLEELWASAGPVMTTTTLFSRHCCLCSHSHGCVRLQRTGFLFRSYCLGPAGKMGGKYVDMVILGFVVAASAAFMTRDPHGASHAKEHEKPKEK